MFVHVVLTEDLREDWTCPTEPPLKIKSLLLLFLLLLLLYSGLCKTLYTMRHKFSNLHLIFKMQIGMKMK